MATETLALAAAARLAAWLSPSFPIGAYSYSHGLERAIEAGEVRCERTLAAWLGELLAFGSGRTEAVWFGCSWDAALERESLLEVAELAHALRPSAELALESSCQGEAFLAAVANAWPHAGLEEVAGWHAEAGVEPVLPVVAGAACRVHGLPRTGSLALYLHAFFANLISAGVRLVPLGQAAGQRVVAALEPRILAAAAASADASLTELGSACPAAEIFSMQHETQYTRLFRS